MQEILRLRKMLEQLNESKLSLKPFFLRDLIDQVT